MTTLLSNEVYQLYTNKMIDIQNRILTFIDNDINIEENFENIVSCIHEQKFKESYHEMKLVVYMIAAIAKNHNRVQNFSYKIENIIIFLVEHIQSIFTNYEIFNLFKGNKVILLFLIEGKVIHIDRPIYEKLTSPKFLERNYHLYFQPEIQEYIKSLEESNDDENNTIEKIDDDKWMKEIPDDFVEKRKNGENNKYLSLLIREDSTLEFIDYVANNVISLDSKIEPSMYETNLMLIRNEVTLIEYAAFYGSINILQYLYDCDVQITPSLWTYGIHSNNAQVFLFLVQHTNDLLNLPFELIYKEAIKCHHHQLANFVKDTYLVDRPYMETQITCSFKYYNFAFYPSNLDDNKITPCACESGDYNVVILILKTRKNELEEKKVLQSICF